MEPMVHIDSRDAFSSRLREALRLAEEDGHGMGARLARKAHVTPKAASKWLNGETRPGHDKLVMLCSWLNVREEWLAYGRGPMRPGANDHLQNEYPADSGLATQAEALAALASPRSEQALRHIAQAAREGRITEEDLLLLEQIAKRIAAHPERSRADTKNHSHERLKKKLGSDDSPTEP